MPLRRSWIEQPYGEEELTLLEAAGPTTSIPTGRGVAGLGRDHHEGALGLEIGAAKPGKTSVSELHLNAAQTVFFARCDRRPNQAAQPLPLMVLS